MTPRRRADPFAALVALPRSALEIETAHHEAAHAAGYFAAGLQLRLVSMIAELDDTGQSPTGWRLGIARAGTMSGLHAVSPFASRSRNPAASASLPLNRSCPHPSLLAQMSTCSPSG